MSKRAHQAEQQGGDGDVPPEPGDPRGQQMGEHPEQDHDDPNQQQQAGAQAQGNPQHAANQDLIDIDNIVITDDDRDSPELKALKNYTRQMQAENSDMHQSIVNQNRLLDNKKVDNARLLREKQKLAHDMDSLSKQMEKLRASSLEAEVKQVVQPDEHFAEKLRNLKHANPMTQAEQLIIEHHVRQERLRQSYEKPLIDPIVEINPLYGRQARRDSDDDSPRTRQSSRRLISESSILQAFDAEHDHDTHSYPHPKRLTKSDSVEDLSTQTIYDVDDWKRVHMKTPQQDQLDNREKVLKAENNAVSQQNLFIKILEKIQPQTQAVGQPNLQCLELDSLIQMAKQTIKSQKAYLEKVAKEVKQTKQVATYYSHSLTKPTLYEFVDYNVKGTKEALQAKNIKYVIDSFDPDKNPDQDFGAIWRKVLMHTNNLRLDEAAYKDILTVIVQGSAAHVLFELIMEQKPLHQILQTFSDLYTKSKTIVDHMNDLNQFTRKSGETIVTAMRRARVMAERVRHLWAPALWDNGKRLEILTSILKQIIDQKTRKHLEYEEMKYLKTGTILEYRAILDIVETYESTNGLIPVKTNPLLINVCTGVPNIMNKNEQNIYIHSNRRPENMPSNFTLYAIEGMETDQPAYKPKIQFPPRSDPKLKENPIWKKAKTNKGNERATKSPSRDESRPIRKAVRPSERSRSTSFSRERPRESTFDFAAGTPKVVPDKKDERPRYSSYQNRDSRTPIREGYTSKYEGNKAWHDNRNKNSEQKFYRNNENKRFNRNHSRDRSRDYRSRSFSRDRVKDDRHKMYNPTYPYKKKNFSPWRDNGEQRQHIRGWNQRDRADRTSMYQCKSCRTIHVLGSFCPTTGHEVTVTYENNQNLN